MNTANFLSIPATMFADQEIIVFAGKRFTYGETLDRVRRLASALQGLGVKPGDRVAVPNSETSPPVEKAGPSPRRIITLTSGSSRTACSA